MPIVHVLKLHEALLYVCPIEGVDSEGVISFASIATEEQMIAARSLVASFDDSDPSVEEVREQALKEIRLARQPLLFTLDGIANRAFRQGDTATASAADSATQSLLAITTLPAFLAATTHDAMRQAVMTRYREIAAGVPPIIQAAFIEITSDQ